MNTENPKIKNTEFLNTKKGVFTILLLVFCASLTFACSLGMLTPTTVNAASTTLLSNLIDLDNENLPFVVERDDVLNIIFASFESDLTVTIKNQDDKVVTDYPFIASLSLKDSKDDPITITDTDKDGLVYFDELDEGDYILELTDSGDYDAPEPLEVTIEPPVEYKVVDISDKVVPQSAVNLATDDGQYNNNSQSVAASTNTVEFVESRIEVIAGTELPLLDATGNQIYYYIPVLSGTDNKYLTATDGSPMVLIAVCDENGYLIKGKTIDPATAVETDVVVISESYILLQYNSKDIKATKVTATYTSPSTTVYYGWQTIDNETYYFDKTGTKVTGKQIIQDVEYFFNDDGSMSDIIGIDVSYWQGTINWTKVKASGIDFAIIRIGIMGYVSGSLVKDSSFARNIAGAKAAGIKVGVYFYDAAITPEEAVEEASLCVSALGGQSLDYPIFIDMEYSA
ncbi:MAG: hypothetical protein JJE03_04465, partial [Peptostreptococcaceae bacterium]|nr:hypothetical protein [Peptostreptococcaceae bacterium]